MTVAKALPILMYHHVSPSPGLVTISPDNFRSQMAWLKSMGWHTICCRELEGFLAGESLPAKSVMLSFDDGYLDNYVHAHPILQEFGQHAVLFGITSQFDTNPARPYAGKNGAPGTPSHSRCQDLINTGASDAVMLRWSEVKLMQTAGTFELHSHTHTHTRWDKTCQKSSDKSSKLAADLAAAQEALAQQTGNSPHLCWPQGYYDEDYIRVAQVAGYRYLYTTEPGTVTRESDPMRLPRIVVKNKGADWLRSRLSIYTSPILSRLYGCLRGK